MSTFLSRRSIFIIIILLVTVMMGIYVETHPRVAPGQEPLTDLQNIETLWTQFNQDMGKTRLILIVSPT